MSQVANDGAQQQQQQTSEDVEAEEEGCCEEENLRSVLSEQMMNCMTSPLDHCPQTDHISETQCQPTGGLHRVDCRQGSDACEPIPSTCHSTASDRANDLEGGLQVGPSLVNGDRSTDRMTTSSEVMRRQRQHLDPEHSLDELPPHSDWHESNGTAPPSDQSSVECHDWKFFTTRRVDVPLLLDILLARKHRDRTARVSSQSPDIRLEEIRSLQPPEPALRLS